MYHGSAPYWARLARMQSWRLNRANQHVSTGSVLRAHSQMAHTNPDIVERWCSGSGFVLHIFFRVGSQLIMQTGAFSNVGDLVSVFCSCSYHEWIAERSRPPNPEGSWEQTGLVS